MTSDEAVRLTREHVERQFPKTCSRCGCTFDSLVDFLLQTRHLGEPISYDEADGDLRPRDPVGTISFAHCSCGNTLAVTSEGMRLTTLWRLMRWARNEARIRGTTWRNVVAWVRGEIDRQALAERRTAPQD